MLSSSAFSNRGSALEPHEGGPSLSSLPQSASKRIAGNTSASLVDAGNGCLCCSLHSPRHQIDDGVVEMLEQAVEVGVGRFEAVVIGSEEEHFGIGADLGTILRLAQELDWQGIETRVRRFQSALEGLRNAPLPVVAAPFLYSLGGATEIALAADACQALEEVYLGLVEVGVGLVPAGGGCLAMVERWSEGLDGVRGVDPVPFLVQAAEQLALSRVSNGSREAQRLRYLRPTDGVTRHREHLLPHAMHRALGMARSGYRPPGTRSFRAAGREAAERIEERLREQTAAGKLDEYGAWVASQVATILFGGGAAPGSLLTRQDFLDLERETFLSLCREDQTRDRIREILDTPREPRESPKAGES